jgi:hypothetical protein
MPTAAAYKGPAPPVAGPVGALIPATRNRRLARGWPATVPAAMPTRAPTAAVAAKEPAAPVVGLAGALAPAAMKGGPFGEWERVAAVAPTAVATPTTRSRKAVVAA